jgi:hypothetical protein
LRQCKGSENGERGGNRKFSQMSTPRSVPAL